MPRFRFLLEGLLKARHAAEQEKLRAVAEIERERLAIEDQLRRQQQDFAANRQELRDALVGTVNAHALRLHAASAIQQMRLAQRSVLELAGTHKRLESARAALIEASRARRAIELLRERRFELWRASLDKAEADMLDELAVFAAAKRRLEQPQEQ